MWLKAVQVSAQWQREGEADGAGRGAGRGQRGRRAGGSGGFHLDRTASVTPSDTHPVQGPVGTAVTKTILILPLATCLCDELSRGPLAAGGVSLRLTPESSVLEEACGPPASVTRPWRGQGHRPAFADRAFRPRYMVFLRSPFSYLLLEKRKFHLQDHVQTAVL